VMRATVEPGERSMPPVRMTNVAPIAAMATVLTCNETFERFSVVRNRSVVRLTIITAIRRAANGPATAERKNLVTLSIVIISRHRVFCFT
jgi:hypothetical protein